MRRCSSILQNRHEVARPEEVGEGSNETADSPAASSWRAARDIANVARGDADTRSGRAKAATGMVERIEWLGTPAQSDADLRIARLTALAIQAFRNRDKAMRWLRRPRREFGGACPLEMMETEAAARQVELLLRQLDLDMG